MNIRFDIKSKTLFSYARKVKLRKYNEIHESVWVLEMEIETEKPWNDFFVNFLESNVNQ